MSASGDPTPKDTWEGIRDKTGVMSLVNKFTLPDLKVWYINCRLNIIFRTFINPTQPCILGNSHGITSCDIHR